MSNRISKIQHNGKLIIVSDWTNIRTVQEAELVCNETADYVISLGLKGILEIVDVRNSFGTAESLMVVKRVAAKTKGISRKKAVVGVSGTRKILLNAVNAFSKENMVGFETMEEALDWITK
ncbi:MAG TPA: hypothetical protein DCQ31_12845 [Bacteroidales bacterium]|nr:hypothetical protein [Bacteroidales bacterium]